MRKPKSAFETLKDLHARLKSQRIELQRKETWVERALASFGTKAGKGKTKAAGNGRKKGAKKAAATKAKPRAKAEPKPKSVAKPAKPTATTTTTGGEMSVAERKRQRARELAEATGSE